MVAGDGKRLMMGRKSKVAYRPMTVIEITGCKALSGCTFLPGTPHKRFAKDMSARVSRTDPPLISEGQAALLWRLVYRCRRQIGDRKLIEHAQRMNEAAELQLT
jgi:hypothetical protein